MGFMFRLSLLNMKRRSTRTVLTLLGVIIGVVSVVALLALGIGVKREMLKEFGDGSSVLKITVTGSQNYKEKNKLLTEKNLEKLAEIEYVESVSPKYEVDVNLSIGNYSCYLPLTGVPKEQLEQLKLTEDSTPCSADGSSKKPALYMGNSIGYAFYNWRTGRNYKEAEAKPFRENIHGKLEAQFGYAEDAFTDKLPMAGFIAGEEDDFGSDSIGIYCDMEVLKKYLKRHATNGVMLGQPTDDNGRPVRDFVYTSAVISVDDIDHVEFVEKKLKDMGFQTENVKEALDRAKRTTNLIQMLLGGMGTIALIVALIGISNTMITSVYDRVNEIGMLKVVGCDTDELVSMFLFEAGSFGLVGGVLGVLLSFLIKGGFNKLAVMAFEFKKGAEIAIIPWWLVVGAILMSTVFGTLAGYFPSRFAAKMNPIEAVRK